MRIAFAGLVLESASFLPGLSGREDFEAVAVRGPAVVERIAGTNTVPGGVIASCAAAGVALEPIVYADLGAAGSASDAAFEFYCEEIVSGLRALRQAGPRTAAGGVDGHIDGPIDGIVLHLHGAMTTPTRLDPDGELIDRVREAVGPDVPIVVAFDYHANLDADTVRSATAAFGYRLSPHTDMGDTGQRAAICLIATLRGEIRPVMAVAKPGLMVPSIFSATDLSPLDGLVAAARDCGEVFGGYVDVSLFAGFSYADVPNCGFSVVAVMDGRGTGPADGALGAAESVAEVLADEVRQRRHALYAPMPVIGVEDAVARALHRSRVSDLPVVLLEHADRLNDSTHVLRGLIRHRAGKVAVPFLWDPLSAATAVTAGQGAWVRLEVGGRSSPKAGGPVPIEGTVLHCHPDLSYTVTGPMATGRCVRLGPTAVVDAGGIVISLTSQSVTAIDEDCFTLFGLQARDFDVIVLRSKTHFRAAYEAIAAEILFVDTPDHGPADLRSLPYRHVPRDRIYPFTDPE